MTIYDQYDEQEQWERERSDEVDQRAEGRKAALRQAASPADMKVLISECYNAGHTSKGERAANLFAATTAFLDAQDRPEFSGEAAQNFMTAYSAHDNTKHNDKIQDDWDHSNVGAMEAINYVRITMVTPVLRDKQVFDAGMGSELGRSIQADLDRVKKYSENPRNFKQDKETVLRAAIGFLEHPSAQNASTLRGAIAQYPNYGRKTGGMTFFKPASKTGRHVDELLALANRTFPASDVAPATRPPLLG